MTVVSEGDRYPVVRLSESVDGKVRLTFDVPATIFWFRGHFPNFPILPGVAQLDWAIRHARHAFNFETATVQTMKMKFRRPIRPGTQLVLTLALLPAPNTLEFEYADADGIYSSGQFKFMAP